MRRELCRMIDYFAVLQQPRRAWLDAEKLKRNYQELTLTEHPDRRHAEEAGSHFTVINEAYRVLSDPKLRLQHLLNLEGHDARGNQSLSDELVQLFGEIGTFVHDTDELLEKLRSRNSALSKSLLQSDLVNARERASKLSGQLEKLYTDALDELQQLDSMWDERGHQLIENLRKLYYRFAYVGRWMDQIRERQFQLSL
jgi:curved DNA-binding protein CbpA